jgi:hypothetical protein
MSRPLSPLRALAAAALLGASAAVADEPDRVTVGLDEFLQLYDKATKPPAPGDGGPKAPTPATLTQATYEGRVVTSEGHATALFTARLRVENHLDRGWIQLPLLSSEVALTDARVAGKPASVTLEGDAYRLVTDQRGAIDVELSFAVQISEDRGVHTLSFPLIASGATTLTLSVPADEPLDLSVPQGRVMRDVTAAGQRTLQVALQSGQRFAARWQRSAQTTAAAKAEPRLYAESNTLVDLADGLVHATTTVHHTVLFAGVDTFRYDIPDGATVLDVRGSGLRAWTVDERGDLAVQLGFQAEGAWDVTIETEGALPRGAPLSTPILQPLGNERYKGWVGVTAGGNLEVSAGAVQGATPVDVRQLPAEIIASTTQPILLGYKFLDASATIPLDVVAHEQIDVLVTLLDRTQAVTMVTLEGRRLTQVTYEVRNNRRQYLELTLPPGAELWSASVAGRAVQPSQGQDGTILLPLVRSASAGGALSGFSVEVVYVERGTLDGHLEADLPRTDVPSTWVGWTLYLPRGAEATKKGFEGNLLHVDWLDAPPSAVSVLQEPAYQGDAELTFEQQVARGGLDAGAAPVRVQVPLEGTPYAFEKLLALDERLWVGMDVRIRW